MPSLEHGSSARAGSTCYQRTTFPVYVIWKRSHLKRYGQGKMEGITFLLKSFGYPEVSGQVYTHIRCQPKSQVLEHCHPPKWFLNGEKCVCVSVYVLSIHFLAQFRLAEKVYFLCVCIYTCLYVHECMHMCVHEYGICKSEATLFVIHYFLSNLYFETGSHIGSVAQTQVLNLFWANTLPTEPFPQPYFLF